MDNKDQGVRQEFLKMKFRKYNGIHFKDCTISCMEMVSLFGFGKDKFCRHLHARAIQTQTNYLANELRKYLGFKDKSLT